MQPLYYIFLNIQCYVLCFSPLSLFMQKSNFLVFPIIIDNIVRISSFWLQIKLLILYKSVAIIQLKESRSLKGDRKLLRFRESVKYYEVSVCFRYNKRYRGKRYELTNDIRVIWSYSKWILLYSYYYLLLARNDFVRAWSTFEIRNNVFMGTNHQFFTQHML